MGFGLELALETAEPLQDTEKSWALLLLERVGDEVAEHERVCEKVKTGFMSMEVSGKGMPEPLVTRDGRVGVLLGMEPSTLPRDFIMPAGEVRSSLSRCCCRRSWSTSWSTGRDELLRRFGQEGHGHLSRVRRSPVV